MKTCCKPWTVSSHCAATQRIVSLYPSGDQTHTLAIKDPVGAIGTEEEIVKEFRRTGMTYKK